MAIWGAVIPAAAGLIGSLFGKGGKQQQDSKPYLADTGIYAGDADMRSLLGTGAGDYTASLLMQALGDPQGWMSGAGLGIGGGGGATGYGASAGKANASLIDMNDIAYQAKPPTELTEGVFGRMNSAAQSDTQQQQRTLSNQMTLSGQSSTSPFALYMKQKIAEQGARRASEGLGQFYDTFTMGALGRRAGALGQNAQMETGVSQTNAQLQTQANIATAQNRTSASQTNAGIGAQMAGMQAQMAGQRDEMLYKYLNLMLRPVDEMSVIGGGQSSQYQPGSADRLGGLAQIAKGLPWDQWFGGGGGGAGGGGQAGSGYGPYPSGGTNYLGPDQSGYLGGMWGN